MSAYDFTGLSPSDFESLCRDLLERSLGVSLQEFVTGRDKGIDLRHAPVQGRDWIVQCKHFARSGFAKLRSHLLRKEIPKIKKLRPDRYILTTSVGLSPSNVDDLFRLLTPYCQSSHDIIGQNDLNALLRANPCVEQSHFKLWLTSEAVLSRVLHNDVFVQSMFTEEQTKQRLGLYVQTNSFAQAREKLDTERVCILSGIPGVGKTTLAEMLIVEYLMKDWQLISIHQNVNEGAKVFRFDRATKQVFYYDDFLGQISTGEKLGKNEDRALLQLIAAVSRTANKRFILTTREYILAQAKAEHEHLARSTIDLHQFVVSCDDYSDLDKARILANHLYFFQVPQYHIAALVETRAYRSILSHRNYSPRIVEWMTQVTETAACRPTEYPSVFLNRLDDPSKLWTHAFENQISEASRHLLLVLGSCGDGVDLVDLEAAFQAFYRQRAKQYAFRTSPSDLTKALDELEGTFIRIEHSSIQFVVSCHNPSILDFLDQRFAEQPEDVADIVRYAIFFEQVERLFNVFQIAAKRRGKRRRNIDSNIVKEAIGRTLLADSIRLEKVGLLFWRRNPSTVWGRLATCCQIGKAIASRPLRKAIQEHIQVHFDEIDHHPGDLSKIASLLDLIDNCKWLDRSSVERWNRTIFDTLLELEDKYEEPLDEIAVTAQWFVGNRQRFDVSQAQKVEESLANAVNHEIEYNSDRRDPNRLAGNLAIVEELAKSLGRNFSEEIYWLNEAMNECGSADGDDGDSWPQRNHGILGASIESLFDALLE